MLGLEKPTCCRFLAKYSAVLLDVILDNEALLNVVAKKNLLEFAQTKFSDCPIFLERITLFASDDNIFLGGAAAARKWDQVVHRQFRDREFLFTMIADSPPDLLAPPAGVTHLARLVALALHMHGIDGFNIFVGH